MKLSANWFSWSRLYLVPLLLLPFSLCGLLIVIVLSQADRIQPEYMVRALRPLVPTVEIVRDELLVTLESMTHDVMLKDELLASGVSRNSPNCVFALVSKIYGSELSYAELIEQIRVDLNVLGWSHSAGQGTAAGTHYFLNELSNIFIREVDINQYGTPSDDPETSHFDTLYRLWITTTGPMRCGI